MFYVVYIVCFLVVLMLPKVLTELADFWWNRREKARIKEDQEAKEKEAEIEKKKKGKAYVEEIDAPPSKTVA